MRAHPTRPNVLSVKGPSTDTSFRTTNAARVARVAVGNALGCRHPNAQSIIRQHRQAKTVPSAACTRPCLPSQKTRNAGGLEPGARHAPVTGEHIMSHGNPCPRIAFTPHYKWSTPLLERKSPHYNNKSPCTRTSPPPCHRDPRHIKHPRTSHTRTCARS
jgi:hypothetical protein